MRLFSPDSGKAGSDEAERAELLRNLDAALARLAPEEREIIHEDFAVREEAQRKLAEMGPRVRSLLEARWLALQKGPKASLELVNRLKSVLDEMARLEREAWKAEALRDLDRAVAEAPAHYLPPDEEILRKLACPVTRWISGLPPVAAERLKARLAQFEQDTGVPLAIDPRVASRMDDLDRRYEDSGYTVSAPREVREIAHSALRLLLKRNDGERLDFVIRGKAAILTSNGRAEKLVLTGRYQALNDTGPENLSGEEALLTLSIQPGVRLKVKVLSENYLTVNCRAEDGARKEFAAPEILEIGYGARGYFDTAMEKKSSQEFTTAARCFRQAMEEQVKSEPARLACLFNIGDFSVISPSLARKVGLKGLKRRYRVSLANGFLVTRMAGTLGFRIFDREAPSTALVGKVDEPILGVETLEALGLAVDPRKGLLKKTRAYAVRLGGLNLRG